MQNDDAFFEKLIKDEAFKQFVEKKFKLSGLSSDSSTEYREDDDDSAEID
jgi:hypothetical protein